MELMWGLKNLMKSLVPDERVELTKEDCLPMSQGMKIILGRYGFDVKPEIVNPALLLAYFTLPNILPFLLIFIYNSYCCSIYTENSALCVFPLNWLYVGKRRDH
jgi:hypothetical protein